jgi:carbon storage regulator
MLVVSRKPGQQIVIDERITVKVIELGSGRIRLGIDAPKEMPIRRSEIPPLPRDRLAVSVGAGVSHGSWHGRPR